MYCRLVTDLAYTDEQVKALVKVCEDWRREYDPGCPEALYQVDAVNESLADLVESIGGALGWWKDSG